MIADLVFCGPERGWHVLNRRQPSQARLPKAWPDLNFYAPGLLACLIEPVEVVIMELHAEDNIELSRQEAGKDCLEIGHSIRPSSRPTRGMVAHPP